MNIVKLKIFPYRLKFNSSLKTSKETFNVRQGFLIQLVDEEGKFFWGDVSPLPSFGTETLQNAKNKLDELRDLFDNIDLSEIFNIANSIRLYKYPAVKFGLEQAALNLAVYYDFKPVTEQFKFAEKFRIPVSGLIGTTDFPLCEEMIRKITDNKIDTVKLKIGYKDFIEELKCIETISRINNKINIRLDVNGAWSFRKAKKYLEKLSDYNIEYIEQPVVRLTDLYKLSAISKIKIAADESVKNYKSAMEIINSRKLDFIVIKPQVLGSVFDTLKIINEATSGNINIIISSVFESAIGRSILYLLAAQNNHGYAHGLIANRIFENDITELPFTNRDGKIIFGKKDYLKLVERLTGFVYA